jgi:hypothetical protein
VAATMDVAEWQGFVVAAMDCVSSQGGPPNNLLVIPYDLGEVCEGTGVKSVKKLIRMRGFSRLELAVRAHGKARCACNDMSVKVPVIFRILGAISSYELRSRCFRLVGLVWTRDTTPLSQIFLLR